MSSWSSAFKLDMVRAPSVINLNWLSQVWFAGQIILELFKYFLLLMAFVNSVTNIKFYQDVFDIWVLGFLLFFCIVKIMAEMNNAVTLENKMFQGLTLLENGF